MTRFAFLALTSAVADAPKAAVTVPARIAVILQARTVALSARIALLPATAALDGVRS